MNDLERDELVIPGRDGRDEEERGIAAIDDFSVWASVLPSSMIGTFVL